LLLLLLLLLLLPQHRYFATAEVPDCWCVYPWDADDIYSHTAKAEASRARLPHTADSKQQAAAAANGNGAHAANGTACGTAACNGLGISAAGT
jgi:hypothetical protein